MIPLPSLFPWSSTNTFLHFSNLVPYLPSFLIPPWRHHSYVPRLIPPHVASHPPARLINLTPLFGTGSRANLDTLTADEEPLVFTTDLTTVPRPTFALTRPGDIPLCVLIRLGDPVEQRISARVSAAHYPRKPLRTTALLASGNGSGGRRFQRADCHLTEPDN